MDRLVPPVDDLPGAGAMGLLADVDAIARQHAPFHRALALFVERLAATGPPGCRRNRTR